MRTILFFLLLGFSAVSFSQKNNSELETHEKALNQMLSVLRKERNDTLLNKINNQFREEFKKILALDGAFDYPFDLLKSVGKIYSNDKLVRVISWNVQKENFSHDYYAFILKKNERTKKVTVTELHQNKQNLYSLREAALDANNWYGALYYDIIEIQKRNKTYYTLLGYDANNERSTIKLIDILHFKGNTPYLGAPLFFTEIGKTNRIVFEYSANATMSLRYHPEREKIIFDHLSPESPTLKDFREFYVPDLSYDAYEWNGTYWELIEDIVAVNAPESDEFQIKSYDPKTGKVVDAPMKNKWINPQNSNAPIDGGTHRAVLPQDKTSNTAKKPKPEKKSKPQKTGKQNKYSGVSIYDLDKSQKKKIRKDKKK